jgi:hypothetical protein
MLTTLQADLLTVAGGVSIQNNNAMGAVLLPALRLVDPLALPVVFEEGSNMVVLNNAALTAVHLPLLEDAFVYFQGNATLTSLDIPNLTRGGADILSNPILPDCEALAVCSTVGVPENRCLPNDHPCYPDPCSGTLCVRECTAPLDYICQ